NASRHFSALISPPVAQALSAHTRNCLFSCSAGHLRRLQLLANRYINPLCLPLQPRSRPFHFFALSLSFSLSFSLRLRLERYSLDLGSRWQTARSLLWCSFQTTPRFTRRMD